MLKGVLVPLQRLPGHKILLTISILIFRALCNKTHSLCYEFPINSNMKFYTGSALLSYSWDQVASAFWARYPNPHSGHVLTEDTVCRTMKDGKLYTKKLLTKTNSMPRWGEGFVPGPRYVCVLEESIIDPKTKSITTYTRNLGFTSIMTVEERCLYQPSLDSPGTTEIYRSAWINSSLYGFSYALQKFGYERFKSNAKKSLKGFEFVLHRLFCDESREQLHQLSFHTNAEKIKNKAKAAKEIASTFVATN